MHESVFDDLMINDEGHIISSFYNIKNKCDCHICKSDNPFFMDEIHGPTICSDVRYAREKNMNGHTYLMCVALLGDDIRFSQELKERLSDVQKCDKNGSNALIYVCGSIHKSKLSFLQRLIVLGVEPNVTNMWGLDAFLTAVLVNNMDCFVFLISERKKMFTNFVYSDGDTVLHKACRHKNSDFAKLLCEHIDREIICTPNRYGKLAIDVWGDITYKTSIVEIACRFRSFFASTDETKAEIDEAKVDEATEDFAGYLETLLADLK